MPDTQAPERIDPQRLGEYLDVMSKAVFQTGISWRVVESKWPGTQEAFHHFDVVRVADLTPVEIDALAVDTRIIRNRKKIEAIQHNAQRMLDLEREHGTFRDYLQVESELHRPREGHAQELQVSGRHGHVLLPLRCRRRGSASRRIHEPAQRTRLLTARRVRCLPVGSITGEALKESSDQGKSNAPERPFGLSGAALVPRLWVGLTFRSVAAPGDYCRTQAP